MKKIIRASDESRQYKAIPDSVTSAQYESDSDYEGNLSALNSEWADITADLEHLSRMGREHEFNAIVDKIFADLELISRRISKIIYR